MRRVFFAVSVIVVGVALRYVPLPLVVISPAPASPVLDAVQVTGAPDRLTGELLITTVNLVPASAVRAVDAGLFDQYAEVRPRSEYLPEGVGEREFREAQARLFEESVRVAAAVGLRLSGREVSVSGQGAEVVRVAPGSRAEGLLQPGDVIVGVNGEPVRLATDLAVRTTRAAPGEKLRLAVRRDDAELDLEVAVGTIPGTSRTGLGVSVMTVHAQVTLPEGIDVADVTDIGGSSGGLMLALAVYDLFDPVDLTRGRRIAGTGQVTLTGAVGDIGGVEEKVRGAELAHATIFLAPAGEQANRARQAAAEGIEVIGVHTVEDAVEALRR